MPKIGDERLVTTANVLRDKNRVRCRWCERPWDEHILHNEISATCPPYTEVWNGRYWELKRITERIVAAAIRQEDGIIYIAERPGCHADILRNMWSWENYYDAEFAQGFITDLGRFVDRFEAMVIARAKNQLLKPTTRDFLISEDVW